MGEWSRTRSVRLTADENNAEVGTRAQKTRNNWPAHASRTTAARAHSSCDDAPEHVSVTMSGSCSRAVVGALHCATCPPRNTPPPRSQALSRVQLQTRRTALARTVRTLGCVWPPQTADRIYPTTSLASQEKAGNGATPLLEGANASSVNWLHPQITKIHTRLLMKR